MDVIRKQEYEIDPNSSFNKLRNLQKTLKQESALRETFTRNKDEILKSIDQSCFAFYTAKLGLFEQYENSLPELEKEHFILTENASCTLPQCIDPLYKLMFYFRNDNHLMLRLIGACERSSHELLANFIAHFCYENVFSSEPISESFMVIITFLLEKEVDALSHIGDVDMFLNESSSFLHTLLVSLSRKHHIRRYLDIVLKDIIIDFENLNNKTSEKNELIAFTLNDIRNESAKNKRKVAKHKRKGVADIKAFLTENITHSNIEEHLKTGNTKINNETAYDESEDSIQSYELAANYTTKYNYFNYDDIEWFFTQSKIFEQKDSGATSKSSIITSNTAYEEGMTEEFLKTTLNDDNTSSDMKEWINFHLSEINNNSNNSTLYTVDALVTELSQKDYKEHLEKTILMYKYIFNRTKIYVDNIIGNVLQHKASLPLLFKHIACLIDKYLYIKFPNEYTSTYRNMYILKFFFHSVLLPTINTPAFNGLVPLVKSPQSKDTKFQLFHRLLSQLTRNKLFNNLNKDESIYTLFNTYIYELMPYIHRICNTLCDTTLPIEVNSIVNDKQNGVADSERVYNFDYLKMHPEMKGEHQSMCFNFNTFKLIYSIIKNNENVLVPEQSSIVYKTYKKMSFHESTIDNKITGDFNESKKTFIFITKMNFNANITKLISAKKDKGKFSFNSKPGDLNCNENETFILQRVMYSINTIIRHLNPLTRANFSTDSQDMVDFVKGLNKMIELEGFSEMLKEKTLPLEWFGLYLQSNIENIPVDKKRQNYGPLYNDLTEESNACLESLKSDDSLDIVYSKLKVIQTHIDVERNYLRAYRKALRKFKVVNLFNEKIKLCFKIKEKKDTVTKHHQITMVRIQLFDATKHRKLQIFGNQKRLHVDAETLNKLLDAFPHLEPMLGNGNDLLEMEKNLEIPKWFEHLFDNLETHIVKEELIEYDNNDDEEEKTNELKDIMVHLFNLFHHKIYNCVFPEYPRFEQDFFRKTFYLHTLKPSNYHSEYAVIDDDCTLETAQKFIVQMDKDTTPLRKVYSFSKAVEIVKSVIAFNDVGNEKTVEQVMVCVVVQSKCVWFYSNSIYIKMYITEKYNVGYVKEMITLMEEVVKRIVNFNEEELETPLSGNEGCKESE